MRSLLNVHFRFKRLLLPMVGVFLLSLTTTAQTSSLTCTDRNTTLDGITCMNTFTPADLGGDNSIHTLTLQTPGGVTIANNEISSVHVGQRLIYTITRTSDGAILCWAYLNVEDKALPIIICPADAELSCSQSTAILATATATNPLVNATATDCFGSLTVTSFDQVQNLECQDNALNFDGVDDFVTIADDPSLNFDINDDFTVETWLRLGTQTDLGNVDNSIIEKWSGAGNYPFVIRQMNSGSTDDGKIRVGRYSAPTFPNILSSNSLDDGEWHHIAFVKDGSNLNLYVDGILDGTVTDNTTGSTTNTSELFLGKRGGAVSNYWNGDLDELRIWSDARTATEITDNLNSEIGVSETGLSHYYSFNQGVGEEDNTTPAINALTDDTGTLNGVLSNFTLNTGISNWIPNRFMGNEFSQVITRTFVAIGTNGKRSSCTQEIKIQRADLDDVTMPSDYSESCSVSSSIDPSVTGYPTYDPDGIGGIDSIPLIPGETGGACMLISGYTDNVIPKCGPEQLIKRTWQVLNMCQEGAPNEMIMIDQIITITAPDPTIDPIAAITISADGGVTGIHGGCSSTATLPTATVSGLCTGQNVQASNIVISIPGIGQIVNGGTITSPGLPLGGPYTITYMATDDCGNIGTLDVEVTVVDNTAPQCNTQNANITLTPAGIAQAGFATFDRNSSDNCSGQVWVSVRRLNGLCTTGVEDDFGPTVDFCCDDVPTGIEAEVMVQQLTCDKDPALASNYSGGVVVLNSDGSPGSTFTGNCSRCMAIATVKLDATPELTCPADVSVTCTEYSSTTAFGTPTIGTTCTSTTLTQDFTDAGTLGCAGGTITRTHRLLSGTTVLATCTQTITVTGGLTITAPADVTDLDCALYSCTNLPPESVTGSPTITGVNCSAGAIVLTATDVCNLVNGALVITRTWSIAGAPADCTFPTISQTITTQANCCVNPRETVTIGENIATINLITPFTQADFGTDVSDSYTLEWYTGAAVDAANIVAGLSNDISATGLSSSTQYTWQILQNNNSSCNFSETFSTLSTLIIGRVTSEFGTPIQNVRVALESNQAARVIGKDEVMSEVMTDELGEFEFDEVDLPSLNKLTLVKDGDDRDNVSTRDLLIMARHILGIKEISSPYSYIAADLTGNGKISTGDMLLMQKVVLGITYDLPNNSSWRFVREDHVFDDMNSVLDYNFPEYFTFTGEETEKELSDLNFIAIKVGDLAGAYGAELQGGNSTVKTLSLQTDNQRLLPGAIIEVPIRVGDTKKLAGYQHAYQFDTDKLVFTGVEVGSELELGGNNFGYQHLGDGYLTTSWFDTQDKNIEAGTVIYTLKFEVKDAAQLNEVLSISSEYTRAEAYFDTDKIGAVQFNFTQTPTDQLIVVNSPNPFKESTQIRFEAPKKGDAVIRISDISGREIYRSELSAVKGENQLTINKSDLQSAGIYILKVDLNGSSATQKIIMIE